MNKIKWLRRIAMGLIFIGLVLANTGRNHWWVMSMSAWAASPQVVILNGAETYTCSPGGDYIIYGSSHGNRVIISRNAKVKCFHFIGINHIYMQETADQFQVSRSGGTVYFISTAGTSIKLPATHHRQQIHFSDDDVRTLVVENGQIFLNDQQILLTAAPVSTAEPIYTISGTITAAPHLVTDSDLNDVNADYTSNDTFELAQRLVSPITVGGYLNEPGTGEAGRSREMGDVMDTYMVSLAAGETVSVFIADHGAADIDLYVYDANTHEMIDASMGIGENESIFIQESGKYLVQISTVWGASNYILSMGHSVNNRRSPSQLRLSDPFIPGQIVLTLKTQKNSARKFQNTAHTLKLQHVAGTPQTEMLMQLKEQGTAQAQTTGSDTEGHLSPLLSKKRDTLKAIKQLRRRPDVKYAEPNFIYRAFGTPNDPRYPEQWNYPLIELPAAWNMTRGDHSVVVAVVDSGILLGHPDLRNNLLHNGITGDGYDFVSDGGESMPGDGDGYDPNPQDHYDSIQLLDGESFSHGTHVAGTIAATANNGIDIAGVTWHTSIMPVRVLGIDGICTTYDMCQGIRYAAALPNAAGVRPSKKADIINLSLGGESYSPQSQEVIRQARASGIIVVA